MRKAVLMAVGSMLPVAVAAQVNVPRPTPVEEIGPKQDDPRSMCGAGQEAKSSGRGIIVQGGRGLAIGPKQDDPRSPGASSAGFNPETDPQAGNGAEMIGPKQDDPRKGIIVQGGRGLAIGPKQDDPRSPGLASGYNPDTDPAARRQCAKKKKD